MRAVSGCHRGTAPPILTTNMKQSIFAIIILGMASPSVFAQTDAEEAIRRERVYRGAWMNGDIQRWVESEGSLPIDTEEDVQRKRAAIDEVIRRQIREQAERERLRQEQIEREKELARQKQLRKQREEKRRQEKLLQQQRAEERRRQEEERRRQEQLRREQRFEQILVEKQQKAEVEKSQWANRIHHIANQDLSAVDGDRMKADAMRGGYTMTAGNYRNVGIRRQGTSTGSANPLNPRRPYKPTQSASLPSGWPSGFRLDPNATVRIDSIGHQRAIMALEDIQKEYDNLIGTFATIDSAFTQHQKLAKEAFGDKYPVATSIMIDLCGEIPNLVRIDSKTGEYIFCSNDGSKTFIFTKDGSSFEYFTHDEETTAKFLDKAYINLGVVSAYGDRTNKSYGLESSKNIDIVETITREFDDGTELTDSNIPLGFKANVLSAKSRTANSMGYGYIVKDGKSAVFYEGGERSEISASASVSAKIREINAEARIGGKDGKNHSQKDYKMNSNGTCTVTELAAEINDIDAQVKLRAGAKWLQQGERKAGLAAKVGIIGGEVKYEENDTKSTLSIKGSVAFFSGAAATWSKSMIYTDRALVERGIKETDPKKTAL